MTRELPARPNLEHLRAQAKNLLNQLKAGERNAAALFIQHLPAAAKMTPAQVSRSGFRLADAQSVVARKSGFLSWPALVRHVEQLRQLEGSWEFVDLEIDGTAMPTPAFTESRMLIDGNRFRMESAEATYEGVFTINVEQVPHQIDIEFVEGPEAGNWSYGIFDLDGVRFKLCIGLTGSTRPHSFSTSAGSGHALENLRRVVKARPKGVEGGKAQPRSKRVPVDAAAFNVQMTPLLTRLQGEWLPVQLVQNGQTLPDMILPMGMRTMSGNETKVVFGGQVMVHAKIRIDESQLPIAVDYLNVGRSLNGEITLGIMEWAGDEVRFCMSGPSQPRPTDFSCPPGSGRTLSVWKRK